MPFEHYIQKGGKRLRFGYTTGTCAALAAKAAATMLLTGDERARETVVTPKGLPVTADLLNIARGDGLVRCAVRKDAGDDCDVTDGLLICAEVALRDGGDVVIDGGEGVGRVTREGLDQPVGEAAINRVPRDMIRREVEAVRARYAYGGGLAVTVSVPGGAQAARKTFNPRLGIEGGISILGTSGIVEPQSLQALIDTIEVEIKMLAAQGHKRLVLTPGNYGEAFLAARMPAEEAAQVKCSNFIGEALDFAAAYGFEELALVGHIGKLCKVAAGILNTHSRYADGRMEAITAHAALAGADTDTARRLMEAATADECIAILEEKSLRDAVMVSLARRALFHVRQRAGIERAEVVMFSNRYGLLARASAT